MVIVATAVIVPLAFFPVSKTLWSAIDLAMRRSNPTTTWTPAGSPGVTPRALSGSRRGWAWSLNWAIRRRGWC